MAGPGARFYLDLIAQLRHLYLVEYRVSGDDIRSAIQQGPHHYSVDAGPVVLQNRSPALSASYSKFSSTFPPPDPTQPFFTLQVGRHFAATVVHDVAAPHIAEGLVMSGSGASSRHEPVYRWRMLFFEINSFKPPPRHPPGGGGKGRFNLGEPLAAWGIRYTIKLGATYVDFVGKNSRSALPSAPFPCCPYVYQERWLSGRKRRSRKPVYPRGIVGSNPTLSATAASRDPQ